MEKKKQAVIFDLDGTLWDSTVQVAHAWNQVLEKYGTWITHEQMCSFMGKTLQEIGKLIFPDLPEEEALKIMKECSRVEHPYIREHGGRLYDGVKDMLENLKQEYFLAIVSNSQDGYVQAFLDYTGLWIYFGDMEMAGRTGKCKGENIRLVMERNHLEQAVYVGDTDGDQKAAALAEVPFVYAEYGFGQAENPEYSITEVWKLPELISKIL